jgi:cytochrome P450
MLRDPRDYPEPERFYPERFLKDGAINSDVRDPGTLFFGFGRRYVMRYYLTLASFLICDPICFRHSSCPGKHFAKDTAFLIIASILHTFDILPSLDQDGKELDPTPHLKGGIVA